jgi:serine/threonine protein kinase
MLLLKSFLTCDIGLPRRVDWWSFGILVYELLYGFTPFRGKKRDETFNNILKRPLAFPEVPEVSDECKVRAAPTLSIGS